MFGTESVADKDITEPDGDEDEKRESAFKPEHSEPTFICLRV